MEDFKAPDEDSIGIRKNFRHDGAATKRLRHRTVFAQLQESVIK
jgi:hypothetical protein